MRRKLFTLAAGASAVLCASVCVLWVRSYFAADELIWTGRPVLWEIDANQGAVWLLGTDTDHLGPVFIQDNWRYWKHEPQSREPWYSETAFAGFRYAHDRGAQSISFAIVKAWKLVIPLWFPAALLILLPIRWYVLFRRDRRRSLIGRCPVCGYDLRATPERCPECGSVPGARADGASGRRCG